MPVNAILFYVFAAAAIVMSLLVVVQANPVYSVLLLIGSFLALAGLYVLLSAPFVAVIQIIVYAGAIMVLFLFVVMLLNASHEEQRGDVVESGGARVLGGILAAAFIGEIIWAVSRSTAMGEIGAAGAQREWAVSQIGQVLFRDYAFAFEATSILILVAMLGAISLGSRHLPLKKTARLPNPESRIQGEP